MKMNKRRLEISTVGLGETESLDLVEEKMGADFIISLVALRKDIKPKTAFDRLKKEIKSMDAKGIIDIFDDLANVRGMDEDEITEIHKISYDDICKKRNIIMELICDVERYVLEPSQDMAEIYRKDEILYITGGMSWGDSPEEPFNFFYEFGSIFDEKLMNQCGFRK